MEQLFSAFGVKWQLLIAQVINFAIVLVVLQYFLYKPMLAMLTKRQNMLTKGVEDAAHAAEKLAGADGEAVKRIQVAEESATDIVSAARELATTEKTRLLKEAEARADAVAKDAQARAIEVVARAKRESEKEVARLAILAAEKILAHTL